MTFIDILSGTPWWVWVIFIELLIVGINALRSREVSLLQLIIIPITLAAWALYSFYKSYTFFLPASAAWLIALIIGRMLGYRYFSSNITIHKKNHAVSLPGSWITLALLMAFFVVKYYIGFAYAIDPMQKFNPAFWMSDVITSGLILGTFIGRLAYIMQEFKK